MSDTPLTKWLWEYGPLYRQQGKLAEAINQIMADLSQLQRLPRLQEADRTAVAKALERWKSIHQRVIEDSALPDDSTKEAEHVPECAVHHVPMTRVQGKYGPFWSCHARNEDGSFCSYRPAATAER